MAKEFGYRVWEVEAMPLPMFQEHVLYLEWEARQQKKAAKNSKR